MAALVDHLGLFGLEPIPFNWWKGIGIGLMAVSAWLLYTGEKRSTINAGKFTHMLNNCNVMG